MEEDRIKIKFILERYIPVAVYKAIVKMAISVMPDSELAQFRLTKRWILHRDHTVPLIDPLLIWVTFIPGIRPFEGASVMLLRKKNSSTISALPYCIFVLAFGNIQLQIMVPALSDRKGKDGPTQFEIPRFPTPFDKNWPYGTPRPKYEDLSSGEYTEPRTITMFMHYDRKEDCLL